MSYKLLAVDLDGTLLRRDGVIHEVDRLAIGRLQAAGVPVTIVTGRLYSGTKHVAREAKIEGPIGCVDGSHIVHAGEERALYSRALSGGYATKLRDIIEQSGAASFLFARDSIVHDRRGEPFAGYVKTWSAEISVVDRIASHPHWEHEDGVHAVVSVGTEKQIMGAAEQLREEMGGAAVVLSFAVSRLVGAYAMIVRAEGASKGTAVEWIASHHGCSPAEVVAVGDWLNDVPMFKAVGRSFAMAQAPEAVKAVATDQLVAHGLTGGGIAEAIERSFGRV